MRKQANAERSDLDFTNPGFASVALESRCHAMVRERERYGQREVWSGSWCFRTVYFGSATNPTCSGDPISHADWISGGL